MNISIGLNLRAEPNSDKFESSIDLRFVRLRDTFKYLNLISNHLFAVGMSNEWMIEAYSYDCQMFDPSLNTNENAFSAHV